MDDWHGPCIMEMQNRSTSSRSMRARKLGVLRRTVTGRAGLQDEKGKRMNYQNGTTQDTYGYAFARTLGSIEPTRLAQAYLKLVDAYWPLNSASPRNSAIDAMAKKIARALAVSLC